MIKFFQEIFKWITPPKLSSWQTFICVMLGLFILAMFSSGFQREALANGSFICLLVGATWAGLEKKWFFTPWLTTGLFEILLWDFLDIEVSLLLSFWPTFSGLLWLVPKSFDWSTTTWKVPTSAVRQRFVIIFLSQLLLSCWIQFHFTIHAWLSRYPSLLVDTFEQSVFVIAIKDEEIVDPYGLTLLQNIRLPIEQRLNQQDWSVLEPWLQDIWVPHQLPEYIARLQQQLPEAPPPEAELWEVTVAATPPQGSGDEYEVVWLAQWRGPRSHQAQVLDPYLSELRCQVKPIAQISVADCDEPIVVARGEESEDLTELPWWRRLRLLPEALKREAR